MPKIVYAPILEQAGFLKRKAADVVEQWVAQLDGAMQSWVLTDPINIPSNVDFEIGLGAVRSSEDWGCLVGGMNTILSAWSSGSYALGSTLSRTTSFSTATNSWPNDNTERQAVFKRVAGVMYLELDGVQGSSTQPFTDSLSIISLGKDENGSFADFLTGYVRDFYVKINGVLTNQIPLTNKAQGATQLATVGNINAFMPNYTNAVWRKP